jgi:hypothetical protein
MDLLNGNEKLVPVFRQVDARLPIFTQSQGKGDGITAKHADRSLKWIGDQKDNECEDHEVGVKQDQNARVIQAPLATHASTSFGHSPCGDQERCELPRRTVQLFDMRKARQQQARDESTER